MQRELLLSRFTLMDAFDCCEFVLRLRARLSVCCTLYVYLQKKLPLCTVKKSYIMPPQRNRMWTRPNLLS